MSLSQPIICPSLIGRASALDVLHRLVDSMQHAGAQVLFITGEAGIGKSRLVAEVKAYASEREVCVLQSNCFPEDQAYPYAPLLEMLRAQFARQPPDILAARVAPFARELAVLLPECVTLPPDVPPPPQLNAEQAQRRLFSAFAHCLLHEPSPTLLLLEDLHWCDDSTLDALLYLVRSATRPVLLIGTYRDDEMTPRQQQWLMQLDRARLSQELQLARLTRDEVAAMLVAIFGAGCPVQPVFLDAIYDLAEGNPFYVEELLKGLVSSGDIFHTGTMWDCRPSADLHIPRSLHGLVQQRLLALGATAREVLTLAAVIGRRFDFALLQRIARIDEVELLGCIKELIAAQLVVEESPDQFAFRHALSRQAIYSDLLIRERRGLHRAVAETIEQMYRPTLEMRLSDLAYHFYAARQWAGALVYAVWAGEQARELYAPRSAIEQYTRALDAAHQLAQPPVSPHAPRLELAPVRLYTARGQVYETLGEFEPALADYTRAVDLARATGDRAAEWQALLHLGMLWAGRDYTQAGDYYRRALDLARALEEPALIAHSLNRVGNWHANAVQPQEALHLHQEALAIFERLQDRPGTAQTLDLLGMASQLSVDRSPALVHYERAVSLFRELDDPYGLATGLIMTMSTRAGTYFRDDMRPDATSFARAVDDGERGLEQTRALDWRAGESFALWAMGTVLGFHGAYRRALDVTRQGLRIAEEIEHQQWQSSAHWTLGMTYLDLLALTEARMHLECALRLGKETHSIVWVHQATSALAVVALLERRIPRAEALLRTMLDPSVPTAWGGMWLLLWARMSLALARRDPAHALHLLNQVSPPGPDGRGQRDTLRVARLRGEALAALGRAAEAETVLTHLRDVAQVQGVRSQLWRCHLALGSLLHARKRYEDAQRAFLAAHNLITGLAADVPDVSLRESFVQRATARIPRRYSPSSRRAKTVRYGGLTSRECEVAALVAQNKSNREIADALVIGERTVETHISNILAKLNHTSRQDIAAWALAHGLGAEE